MKTLSSPLKIIAVLIFSLFAVLFQQITILAAEKIDINTASLEYLIKITHIGPARAAELISLRPLSSLSDLIKIKGIGEKRLENIKKQGLAWVSPEIELVPAEKKPQQPKHQPIVYPSNILINEILPSPKGPDAEKEWIEIFNQNNFEVDISDWQIVDTIGKTKSYIFPEKTLIKPKGFLILARPISKITLNNSNDGLKLLQPNEKIADSMDYKKAPREQSYNRTDSKWAWSPILTLGAINILPTLVVELEQKTSPLKAPEHELTADIKQIYLPIRQNSDKNNFIFIIALIVSVFSGIIILILKNLKQK